MRHAGEFGEIQMLTRRNLIEGAGAVAAIAAVGGVSVAFAGQGEVPMRPPGAQDEERFIGSCVRCDRCRSVCPTNVIGVSAIEDGLINVRTPKMEFRLGCCDTCGGAYKCAEVCPMGSIAAFDTQRDRIGVAVIDTSVCLTYGISGSCSANCIDPCPEQALRIDDDGRLVLDEAVCWGCGACEYYCVSDSYGAYTATGNRGINVVRTREWGA